MATPPVSNNPTTQRQYLAGLALTAALTQALRGLWSATTPQSSERAMVAFRSGVLALVEQFSAAARSVAVDYYADMRRDADVPGTTQPTELVPLPPQSLVDAGLDWALRAEVETDAIEAAILARLDASMQKAMQDVGRDQIVASVEGDDRALGFRRVARPGACYWCLTLAMRRSTRGETGDQHLGVYKTRLSAGQILAPNALGEANRYHDNCHCTVEPIFAVGDQSVPSWMADMQRLYETSTAHSRKGDRLNDFRRALAALRRGGGPSVPTPPAIGPVVANDERLRLLGDLLADFAA